MFKKIFKSKDELSADFVKGGFKYYIPEIVKEAEFGGIVRTDQPLNINPNFDSDALRLLISIANKKEEASMSGTQMSGDAGKKQQAPPKLIMPTFRPSLILITSNQKTKESAYAWFKQLASNEPLAKLAKKIPVFNKRADNLPEILITLYEYQVPIARVVWYIKIMIIAYSTSLNEVQKKKRQPNVDVSSEWSIPMVKFMREIFYRLHAIDQQHHSPSQPQQHQQFTLESFMNVENLSLVLIPVITSSYLTPSKLRSLWQFTTKSMR
jgi:hypothetical protein